MWDVGLLRQLSFEMLRRVMLYIWDRSKIEKNHAGGYGSKV